MKLCAMMFFLLAMCGLAFAAEPVDVNTATQEQLESVKGIGPKKAQAIIEYREQNGEFKTIDDLDNVKGFSKIGIAKMQDRLAVGSTE